VSGQSCRIACIVSHHLMNWSLTCLRAALRSHRLSPQLPAASCSMHLSFAIHHGVSPYLTYYGTAFADDMMSYVAGRNLVWFCFGFIIASVMPWMGEAGRLCVHVL
jgi:hypothetical protein